MKKPHKRFLITLAVLFFVYVLAAPVLIVNSGSNKVYKEIQDIPNYNVTIVFGAGLKYDGKPSDILRDRLDKAAELYQNGQTKKILVSGDNRVEDYNEPESMFKYLTEQVGLPEEDVIRDFGGRRTYDTCKRAQEIWGVDKALLITQGYHLPRAIFTCRGIGIDAHGYSSTATEYLGEFRYKVREVIAIHRSIVDVYIWTPKYISGHKEGDLDNLQN
jgi:vancomycin permeability regulator SanA